MSPFIDFVARSVENTLDLYLRAVEEPGIMSLSEASELVSYSQEYPSLLARRGAIAAFKRGRNWYITRRELDRYVDSMEEKKSRKRAESTRDYESGIEEETSAVSIVLQAFSWSRKSMILLNALGSWPRKRCPPSKNSSFDPGIWLCMASKFFGGDMPSYLPPYM